MLPVLAERLRESGRRILFVVGKGGVGKSTTAAAVALHLADSGVATHLLSTDPAHSVGDVFGVHLAGGPDASPCTPALTLEELDAPASGRAWMDRAARPISMLVERGTYLDAEDAASLAALSLPGADEVAAVLRLVELAGGDAQRIVVDTAPTGHTLRLLDAGELIEGWAVALDAMAEKARAVGAALVGARFAPPGREIVAELRASAARFREDVLRAAGFLVVARVEQVVSAETRRLVAELSRRELAVEAVLVVGGDERSLRGEGWSAPADQVVAAVPLGAASRGCAALRAWGRRPLDPAVRAGAEPAPAAPPALAGAGAADTAVGAAPAPAPADTGAAVGAGLPPARAAAGAAALPDLPRELFLFAGKGGVGKTTCAAAFALALGGTRDVVLLSTDPAGSLEDVLGVEVPPGGARVGRLLAQQVDAAAELERIRQEYRSAAASAFEALGLDRAAALDRAVVEALWGMAPPGVDELLALVKIIRTIESGAVLVIDPAPTGHFLRLLELPQIALDWLHALMRLILKYGLARNLDALARDLLQSARDLKDLLARLADPERTATFVVTLDEPLVAAETGRLIASLQAAGMPVAGIVLNRADAGPSNGGGSRSSGGATAGAADPVPTWVAPLLASPPIGTEALQAFLWRWESAR